MPRTTSAHVEAAERLLAQGTAGPAAAGLAYRELALRFAPLIGGAGVRALFARSVNLTKAEFACLGDLSAAVSSENDAELATTLAACLSKLEPETASRVATALYATLFGLMTDFIGERLVWQILRRAPPMIDQGLPKETCDE